MTKEKIIEKVDKKLLTFKLDRLMRAKTGEERYMIKKEIFCYIDNLFSFQKQEIVEEIEKIKKKTDDFMIGNITVKEAFYMKMGFNQALKRVKEIDQLKQTLTK